MKIQSIINDTNLLTEVSKYAAKHNPENFSNFLKRIHNYVDFFVVLDDNKNLVAMSGIYQDPTWPKHHYRIGDRTFYNPTYRTTALNYLHAKGNATSHINSQLLLPAQLKIVLELKGIPFYSMLNRPNALARSVKTLNEVLDEENYFTVLEEKYFTCPLPISKIAEPDRCWQHIALRFADIKKFRLLKEDTKT